MRRGWHRWLPQKRIGDPAAKLCIDCRYYVPAGRNFWEQKPNPRWAECAHPMSLEPPGEKSLIDGSIPPQRRSRCIEARSVWSPYKTPHCGPEAQYWEPR